MKSEVCTWFGHAMLWGWKEKKMWFCLEDLSDCLVLRIKSGCRKDSEGDGADADGDSRWDRMHDLALSTVFHRLQLWDGLGVHFPLFLEGLLSFWWSGEDTKGMSGSALWALVRACILCLCQEMWNSPDLTLFYVGCSGEKARWDLAWSLQWPHSTHCPPPDSAHHILQWKISEKYSFVSVFPCD
jgi:hypothetical protein